MKDVLKENEKIHMEEKLFSCTFCKKKFAPQDALKENEKIHSGEKLFTCSYCKKKFVLKDELKTQERIHSGERPFSCSHCKKKFVLKDKLKEHERSNLEKSHSPVLIARRNSSWRKTWESMKGANLEKSHSSDLVAEEIHPKGRPERAREDHSGEKPFTCSDCKRKFVPKNDLREHENRRKASVCLYLLGANCQNFLWLLTTAKIVQYVSPSQKSGFSPGQFGPWRKRKGKSGEIRSLLEALGGTPQPRKKNLAYFF